MVKFKHVDKLTQNHLAGKSCPPSDAVPVVLQAYRWVKSPVSGDCFVPQAIRNPPRLLRAKNKLDKCSCWGLSLHNSLNASKKAFQSLESSFPNIRKNLGGWIAEGKIEKVSGVCTPIDGNGHFDLHEYELADIEPNFIIVEEVPEPA
jgi:hypothetical protein